MIKKLLLIAGVVGLFAGVAGATTFKTVVLSTTGILQAGTTGYSMHIASGTEDVSYSSAATVTKTFTMPTGSTATLSGALVMPAGSTLTVNGVMSGNLTNNTTATYTGAQTFSSATVTNASVNNLAIGSVTVNIPMSGHKETNLSSGTQAGDSVRFEDNHAIGTPVSFTETTGTTTTSNTFILTPTTTTVPTQTTSSKVLITFCGEVAGTDTTGCFIGIQRNGTNIFAHDASPWIQHGTAGSPICGTYIDSPATQSSALGYAIVIANQSTNSCAWGGKSATGSTTFIQAWEAK